MFTYGIAMKLLIQQEFETRETKGELRDSLIQYELKMTAGPCKGLRDGWLVF
jgi:hypothetical protein